LSRKDVLTGYLSMKGENRWDGASMGLGRSFQGLTAAQDIADSPSKIEERECGGLPVLLWTKGIGAVAWLVPG